MRVVTWNVNSIRARQARVLAWLERHRPDVALLQETKCTDALFAGEGYTDQYEALGYQVAHHGHDHWNGVAILSRVGLDDVVRGFPGVNRPPYDEARVISAICGGVRVWSIYAPNGRGLDDPHYLFKLVWLERLRAAVAADGSSAPHLGTGDVAAFGDLGLIDVTRVPLPEAGVYTWWSYRPGQFEANRGLRIDLMWCDAGLAERVSRVWIDRDERAGAVASDHAPVVVDLR